MTYSNINGNGSDDPRWNPRPAMDGNGYGYVSMNDPFALMEGMLPRQAKNAIRTVYGVVGVVAILVGAALLLWPGSTLSFAAAALGVYFTISGVVRVVTSIVGLGLPNGWRVLNILVGVLFVAGGVVVVRNAVFSGQAMALLIAVVVGIGWLSEGVMALVESWRTSGAGWAIVYAVISIVAGLVVLCSPISSTIWMVVFGGIALLVLGVFALIRAFTFGRNTR